MNKVNNSPTVVVSDEQFDAAKQYIKEVFPHPANTDIHLLLDTESLRVFAAKSEHTLEALSAAICHVLNARRGVKPM